MSAKTIKLIVFISLLIHGVGHLQGFLAGLGVKFKNSTSCVSWLIKALGENTNRKICLVLYLAASIVGILSALCFNGWLLPDANWQVLALLTAILSTCSLFLFPKALAMFFNLIGAVLINLIIYYSILFNGHWPETVFDE